MKYKKIGSVLQLQKGHSWKKISAGNRHLLSMPSSSIARDGCCPDFA